MLFRAKYMEYHKGLRVLGCGVFVKFHSTKNLVDIYNVDINHILVSSEFKDPIGKKCFKYFIGYLNHSDGNLTPLSITLPKLKVSLKVLAKQNILFML